MAVRNFYSDIPTKDTFISEEFPDRNWGGETFVSFGWPAPALLGEERRGLVQFISPVIPVNAEILTRMFSGFMGSPVTDIKNIFLYKLDDNREIWRQGDGVGLLADAQSASWDDYVPLTPWTAPGGDFDENILTYLEASIGGSVRVNIPLGDFLPEEGDIFTLVLRLSYETTGVILDATEVSLQSTDSGFTANRPYLIYEIEDPNFFMNCIVDDVSSQFVDISWTPKLPEECPDFKHYLVESAPAPGGPWTIENTETDITVGVYQFEIVPNGDVDLYDHNLDTYPEGRTLYFRTTLVVEINPVTINDPSLDQEISSPVVEHTSLPALRSMSFADDDGIKFDHEVFNLDFDNLNNSAYDDDGKSVSFNLAWFEAGDETALSRIEKLEYEIGISSIGGFTAPVLWGTPTIVENDQFNLLNIIIPFGGILNALTNFGLQITVKITELNGPFRWITFTGLARNIMEARIPTLPSSILKGGGGLVETGEVVNFDARFSNSIQSWQPVASTAPAPWDDGSGLTFDPILDKVTSSGGGWATIDQSLLGEMEYGENRNIMWKGYVPVSGLIGGSLLIVSLNPRATGVPLTTGYAFILNGGGGPWLWTLFRDGVAVGSGSLTIRPGTHLGIEMIREDIAAGANKISIFVNFTNNKNAVMDEFVILYTDPTPLNGGTAGILQSVTIVVENFRIMGKPFGMSTPLNQGFQLLPDFGDPSNFISIPQPVPLQVFCDPTQASTLVTVIPAFTDKKSGLAFYRESDSITVTNGIPIAVLFASSSAFTNTNVTLNGTQSFDPEGSALTYTFDFGDGSPVLISSDAIVTHTYSAAGTITLTLTVTDELGVVSAPVTREITIIDLSADIVLMTFLAVAPFLNVVPRREPGLKITPIVNKDENYLQTTKSSGRVFGVTGYTAQCDNTKTRVELIAETKAELDTLDLYERNSIVIEIEFPFYGIIRGIITDLEASPDPDNVEIGNWKFDFVEVTELSLGES